MASPILKIDIINAGQFFWGISIILGISLLKASLIWPLESKSMKIWEIASTSSISNKSDITESLTSFSSRLNVKYLSKYFSVHNFLFSSHRFIFSPLKYWLGILTFPKIGNKYNKTENNSFSNLVWDNTYKSLNKFDTTSFCSSNLSCWSL